MENIEFEVVTHDGFDGKRISVDFTVDGAGTLSPLMSPALASSIAAKMYRAALMADQPAAFEAYLAEFSEFREIFEALNAAPARPKVKPELRVVKDDEGGGP